MAWLTVCAPVHRARFGRERRGCHDNTRREVQCQMAATINVTRKLTEVSVSPMLWERREVKNTSALEIRRHSRGARLSAMQTGRDGQLFRGSTFGNDGHGHAVYHVVRQFFGFLVPSQWLLCFHTGVRRIPSPLQVCANPQTSKCIILLRVTNRKRLIDSHAGNSKYSCIPSLLVAIGNYCTA